MPNRSMKRWGEVLEGQINIGPAIATRLREIGVHTLTDLKRRGAAGAYLRICRANPGKTIPVCYYLYSLEGAILGVRWDAIGSEAKLALLRQVGRR